MTSIRIENAGGLLVVTMARGKANALNAAMIGELHDALDQARASDVRGVVLASDRPNIFSGGFDATEVFRYERETMTSYFGSFMDLYEGLFRLPKPVVAAINGHAVAGGAVLALACDERVMAEGAFKFALNEVNLGVVLPPGVMRMVVEAVGPRHAREILLSGEAVSPEKALAIGLAAELAPPEQTLDRAMSRARALAEKPAGAFGAIKRTLLEVTGHAPEGSDRAQLPLFIDHWFSAESRERRSALVESLRK
jgi:enoyl-CoA hydratase/carnithine racemase